MGRFPFGGAEDAFCPDFGPEVGVHSSIDSPCELIPHFLTIHKLPEFRGEGAAAHSAILAPPPTSCTYDSRVQNKD